MEPHTAEFEPFNTTEIFDTVDAEKHRQAFRENVELVLPHVCELLDAIDGLSVITADHGQMLGERAFPIPLRYHVHRHGVYVQELVEVPWFIHESGNRRDITTERGRGNEATTNDDEVVERLHDLGYMEY